MDGYNSKDNSGKQARLSEQLNERAQSVLRLLIKQYIRDGQPVGSKTLSQLPGINASSATIRHVMGDLESLGLLHSPHTSAGRVPTAQAYRVFVDSMVQVKPLDRMIIGELEAQLREKSNRDHLVRQLSEYISTLTNMASVVFVPPPQELRLRQIEFLRLSPERLLVILISEDLDVQNRVVEVAREYSDSELTEAANFINERFAGQSLPALRARLHEELQRERQTMQSCLDQMLSAVDAVLGGGEIPDSQQVHVSGQSHVVSYGGENLDRVKSLFEALNRKTEIYDLLRRCVDADGMQVFIGEEAGVGVFQDCSVVTSTYQADRGAIGVLGVIGPTRMPYERVISVVDISSKLLSAALNNPK